MRGPFVLSGMSTKKNTALVASALTMTLAASLFAAAPANAAPAPSIPKQVALKKKDVRHLDVNTVFDLGTTTDGTVTFAGQYCDATDNGATGLEPLPELGRWWTWSNETSDLGVTVDHVVTTWADGDAALVDVQNDTGHCRVFPGDSYTVVVSGDDEWVAQFGTYAVAVRQVGNTLVSVAVTDWGGGTDELAEAQHLIEIAAAKIAKSNKLP